MNRRSFVRSIFLLIAASTILKPQGSLVHARPAKVFNTRRESEILDNLFGGKQPVTSNAVRIDTPKQVKTGHPVPCTVSCALDNVSLIAVVSSNNHFPLNTYMRLDGASGYYRTQIRLEKTSGITAYVMAGNQVYANSVHVKVNRGGYGMH